MWDQFYLEQVDDVKRNLASDQNTHFLIQIKPTNLNRVVEKNVFFNYEILHQMLQPPL
jgi:hypothetical protein